MTFAFHDSATKEFDQAVRWYRRRNPDTALELREEVYELALQITAYPAMFARQPDGRRIAQLRQYPYYLVFEWRLDLVAVIAVAHGKRRPGYWKRRTMGRYESELL